MGYRVRVQEHDFLLPPGESIIGRDKQCQVRIDDPAVSRRHARLLVLGEQLTIEDIKSLNGVLVNGEEITGSTRLKDSDRLVICGYELQIHEDEPAAAWKLEEPTFPEGEIPASVMAYQAPIYRTCPSCRQLLEPEDQVCSKCGAYNREAGRKTMRLYRDPLGRRSHVRTPVRLRALYVSASLTIEGVVSDCSVVGAFFQGRLLDVVGTSCDLLLFPSADGDVVRIACEVVRTHGGEPSGGMGLRFVRMTNAGKDWLQSVLVAEPQR